MNHDLLIVMQIGKANACAMAALRGFFAYRVMSAILTANAMVHIVNIDVSRIGDGRNSLALPPIVANMVEQKT